jgi:hypothetical protein
MNRPLWRPMRRVHWVGVPVGQQAHGGTLPSATLISRPGCHQPGTDPEFIKLWGIRYGRTLIQEGS